MGVRFRADSRGVSEVVGAVLLLGILMLTLSIYQVSVVPNQNAAAEFEHSQQVENEIVDVRNAILEARSSGEDSFASITLGTRYQSRLLTVNPPSPSGTLRTVKQRNISVIETGGDMRDDPLGLADRPLENQFIEYTPRYYAYDRAGTIRYENTVAYHEYAESNVFLTDQTLLRGDTVSLIPLEGAFRRDGMGRVAVEPTPGVLETVQVDDPNITVPTELPQGDWEELLADELEAGDTVTVSDGNLTLSLDGTYDVAYAPVGVNRVPSEGQRTGGAVEINPAAPGDVQLVGADWSGRTVELTFRNSAENTTFTDGRINFYTGSGGTPDQADFVNATAGVDNPRGTNWVIGDDFGELEPNIELEGNGSETSIDVVFDNNVQENNDFFIITLTLESGQQATYFVGGTFSFDSSDSSGTTLDITNIGSSGTTLEFDAENIGGESIDLVALEVDNADRSTYSQVDITGSSPTVDETGPFDADGTRINHDASQLNSGQTASYSIEFDGTSNIKGESIQLRIYYDLAGTEGSYQETVTVP